MFELNIFSVFATTFLAIAVGVVWYSPWAFGRYWISMMGMDNAEAEKEGQGKRVIMGALSHFALFFILGQLLILLKADQQSVRLLALLLAGMAVVLCSASVIWERKPLAYFFITSGYEITIVMGGIYIIFYWPW